VQGADVLLTIAEVAVAFAGFASIVVLFQHRDPLRWPPAVVVRLRTMIEGSLVTLFSALLPFILFHFGMNGEALWATCSLLFAASICANAVLIWRRSKVPLSGGHLSRSFTITVGVITAFVLAALILNSAGLVFPRTFGPYLVGVAWNLVFASLMFLRVVILPSAPENAQPPDA
jgi:hypothetical protein